MKAALEKYLELTDMFENFEWEKNHRQHRRGCLRLTGYSTPHPPQSVVFCCLIFCCLLNVAKIMPHIWGAVIQGWGTCGTFQSSLVISPNVPYTHYVHRCNGWADKVLPSEGPETLLIICVIFPTKQSLLCFTPWWDLQSIPDLVILAAHSSKTVYIY